MNIENIKIILDYYLDDEIANVNSSTGEAADINLEFDSTQEAIEKIEIYNETNYIAYNLLKLKLEMEEEIKKRENGKKISRSLNESHL